MYKFKLIATLMFFSTNLYAESFEELIVFPGDNVNNKSHVFYANMWWQWSFSMPKNQSPVRDLTGEKCHVGQSGDVWFLAGGYGSSTIRRTCEIPEGKHIFFPVINMVYYPRKEGLITCADAKNSAALNNDNLISIEIEVDSLKSSNPAHSRVATEECFDLLGLVPRSFNPPRIYPAATDGFWIMLKPLSKGTHSLKFKARYNRENGAFSKMAQDIEYKLIIR